MLLCSGDGYIIAGSPNDLNNPSSNRQIDFGSASWLDSLLSRYNKTLMYSYNFATSGATIDNTIVRSPGNLPSLVDQVTKFGSSLGSHSADAPWTSSNALFTIWVGATDINNEYSSPHWNSVAQLLIRRYFEQAQRLYDLGARNFVFLTVPPIHKTPFAIAEGAMVAQRKAAAVVQYNQLLSQAVSKFKSTHNNLHAVLYDTTGPFNYAISNPDNYGAADATCVHADGKTCLWSDEQTPGIAIQDLVAQGLAGLAKM